MQEIAEPVTVVGETIGTEMYRKRQRLMDRIPVWTAIILFLAAFMSACESAGQTVGDGGAQAAATVTPIPTAPAAARPTYTVQRGTVEEVLPFTARWLPRDQYQLSFEVSGAVRSVNVRRGDTVSAGDLLADYQISDLENSLASAELDLETTRLRLESGTDTSAQSIVDAQFSLAGANIDLESTLAGSPWTNLESARLNLEDARRRLEEAERDYEEALSHPENPSSSVDSAYEQLQSARHSVDTAEISYYSAAQNFNSYQYNIQRSENTVIQRELALERALAAGGADPELVNSLISAQMRVDQLKEQIAQSSLYAPIDGVVLEVIISPGDSVQAYTTVITLAIPEPSEAIANLAFNDTQRLDVNMVGTCQVANRPETKVLCAIRQIPLSSRDADQSVRIGAQLEDMATLGQLIDVEMPLQTRENVLWLPPAAIRTFQNRTFVVIQTPDGERVSDVEIGLQTDDRVEIISGVEEGDIVVGP
jgi:multidrug efflux pump subunit AcrA (membrane-fusion protein)